MKLIIDIPDEHYRTLQEAMKNHMKSLIGKIILNGTLIPDNTTNTQRGQNMTKSDFIYGLTACGCLYTDGKTYYEHDELVKCFEDLGLIKEDKEQNNMDTIRTELKALAKSTDYNPQYVNGIMNSLYIIDKYTKGE